jgi:hypothetical protein
MKKIYLLLVFLACTIGYSQTNGISYQALILNPNLKKMPGINEANTALANQKICLQFIIKDEQRQLEYQETVSTSTDELGMVNVIIGSGSQTGGYAIDFKSVIWNSSTKTLNVGVNISGSCGSFTEVSDQIFNSVPFAFSAGNVTGIVSIENGGTNASNVVDAKINLNLGNVDNTSDVLKPVSTATQTALNLKENLVNKSNDVNTDGSSDIKYPSVKAVKNYVDASATLGSAALGTEVSRALTAETANAAAISAESLARRNGDAANAASILAETSARTDADGLQNTAIGANASAITAETSSRTDADAIQNTAIRANTSAITTETSARTDADVIQNTAIGANASAITAETSARTTAISAEALARTNGDATNAASILAETSSRTDADAIQNTAIGVNASAITAETSSRTTAISAEALARTNGDATNAASILAETSSRTDADALQNTAIGVNASAITAETSARTTSDGLQNTAISDNASAITAETSARTTSYGLQNTAITDEAARAGLAEVANTTAIGSKEDKINKSIDGTFASNSDVLFPTEKATKTYVDAQVTTVTTGNFVDLTTDQTVAGDKTFSNNTIVNGTSIANSFKTPAGKSSQFLKADGSVDSNNYFLPNTSNIAIGYVAGTGGQGAHSIAIGGNVAQGAQAEGGVGLGYAAAQYSQGLNAVAIGSFAGNNGQHDNSIVINASGNSLNGNAYSGLYIDPIRSASGASSLFYDATTKEITYDTVAQNVVDLTTDQKVKGVKTFTSNGTFNGVTIGTGNATGGQNLAVGAGAMNGTSTGVRNTAIGFYSMHHYVGTSFDNNTSVGYANLVGMTSGSGNTSVGAESMMALTTGTENTSVGNQSLISTTGNENVGIGKRAGQTISSGSQNTIIGTNADVGTNNLYNATAIGYGAIVDASDKVQLGNTAITDVKTSGTITAGAVTYPNLDGSANQVLQTNGNGIASWTTIAGPRYASSIVLQDVLTSTTDSEIYLPGLGFRWNQTTKKLEIKGEANNNPQALIFYFSYHTDASNTINFRPDTTDSNSNSWTAVDDSWSNTLPLIEGYYSVYDFDFTVYPLNQGEPQYGKTYNVKILLDGWGAVHMRAAYY